MHAILVGINHKSATIELREKLHFDGTIIKEAIRKLFHKDEVEECAILSTCNRVELYASSSDVSRGWNSLKKFLVEYHQINDVDIAPHLYELSEEEAVTHLFRVASSLDSLVIGENQILGQVKSAYHTAQSEGCTKNLLNRLFQSAISTGKKVRTETAIGVGSLSVGSSAVDLIKEVFPKNYSFKVCLLGAGKISELAAKSLSQHGRVEFTVVNRHLQKAQSLANKIGGCVGKFEDHYLHVLEADVSFVCINGGCILEKEIFIQHLRSVKGSKMRFLIDLSVPRGVDPLIESIDDTVLYCIDDLKKIIKNNEKKRLEEIQSSEQLVSGGVDEFFTWYYKRQIKVEIEAFVPKYQSLLRKQLQPSFEELSNESLKTAIKSLIAKQSSWQEVLSMVTSKLKNPRELKEILDTLKKTNPEIFVSDNHLNTDK